MTPREELESLRRLEELEAKAAASPKTETMTKPGPSHLAVAGNAAVKGVAAIPDAFANAPVHLWNLAKAGYGTVAGLTGHPEALESVKMTTPPSPVHRGAKALGLIRDEAEPEGTGQRILDTAVQGGVGMAIAPASSVGGVVRNVGTGVTGGAAAQGAKEVTGSEAAAIGTSLLTPYAIKAAGKGVYQGSPLNNPVRNDTLAQGRAQGLVVPPSSVNQSPVVNVLESFAGKDATRQAAQTKNWPKSMAMAAEELGLPKDTAMTEAILNRVRDIAAQPYRDIAALSTNAKTALQELKEARFEQNLQERHFARSGDPAAYRAAQKAANDVKLWDQMIEAEAIQAGRPELVPALAEARTKIAKTYDVEHSLNIGDAGVSGRTMGKQLDKDKPLSGHLKTMGKFAEAFPEAMTDHPKAAGVSYTNTIASAILGLEGGHYGGKYGAIVGAALPWARGGVRSALLSGPGQRLLARPDASTLNLGDTTLKAALLARAVADRNGGQ